MQTESTHIVDDERVALAGVPASSSSAHRSGKPVILIFRRPSSAAAFDGLPEAKSLDDGVASIGDLAVRIFADWKLPRLQMTPLGSGEDQTPAATDTLNVGEDRSGSDW